MDTNEVTRVIDHVIESKQEVLLRVDGKIYSTTIAQGHGEAVILPSADQRLVTVVRLSAIAAVEAVLLPNRPEPAIDVKLAR